jgi:hypothetical protein
MELPILILLTISFISVISIDTRQKRRRFLAQDKLLNE